jgi:SAM-dependent methyltransferase
MRATEAFFDDPEYLRTVAAEKPAPESAREALAAARLADCTAGARVLDAGCGAGRHALPLAHEGYRVVGLDRSEGLLRAARRGAEGSWPRFVRGSYARLPFPSGWFDAVLSLGSSLGYDGEEGDRAALREFRRVLVPGGRVVIETLHRGELGGRLVEHEQRPLATGGWLCFERRFDSAHGVMHETQRLEEDGRAAGTRAYDIRVYSEDELRRMLELAGFAVTGTYGSLAGGGHPSATTPLVILGRAGRSSPPG